MDISIGKKIIINFNLSQEETKVEIEHIQSLENKIKDKN
jgi:hypothetical protein